MSDASAPEPRLAVIGGAGNLGCGMLRFDALSDGEAK